MKKEIWILLDNRIGSRHQAQGIAAYLDKSTFEIKEKEINYTKLAALPNIIRGKSFLGVSDDSISALTAPWPDIVLSSSRRTAPIARWIKKQNPPTKLIQLLHIGRWGIKDFTAIFTPVHDRHKFSAPNIKYTLGSPHLITKEKLNDARQTWQDKFSNLPRPITALIVGGKIKKRPFTLKNAEILAQNICDLKKREGGSLLITTSRRTGKEAEEKLMSLLKDIPHYDYLWGATTPNPYLGFLACADNLIVTGDSVSMCCEAAAAGKPLRIYTGTDNWLTPKHLRFVQSLLDNGYAVDISAAAASSEHTPLNAAKQIAEYINSL